MRGKKSGIIWSIRLIIISFFTYFILQFHLYTDIFKNIIGSILPFNLSDWRDFIIVIMSGIFTSSFVTLIMNCSDYVNERRDALEDYYNASILFLSHFQNIEYLHIVEDLELVRAYYLERSSNYVRKSMSETASLRYESKRKLQNWIWKATDEKIREQLKKQEQDYLDARLESIIAGYDQQLERIAQQYTELSELSYQDVENACGKIDFLFTNKLNRKDFIYRFLHNRQRDLWKKIRFESFYFKQISLQSNAIVILDKILKLQNEIFMAENCRYGKKIYNQYCYEVMCNLEFLLQITYKKQYKENYPSRSDYLRMGYIDTQ